eukprot:27278-Pelagococcus_subviridis.AAC.1
MTQHLLVAADRFDLTRLRAMCESRLCDMVDVDTAATTLALAEQNHAHALKHACLEFVAGHLAEVMNTDGYKHMERSCPQLASELLRTVAALNAQQAAAANVASVNAVVVGGGAGHQGPGHQAQGLQHAPPPHPHHGAGGGGGHHHHASYPPLPHPAAQQQQQQQHAGHGGVGGLAALPPPAGHGAAQAQAAAQQGVPPSHDAAFDLHAAAAAEVGGGHGPGADQIASAMPVTTPRTLGTAAQAYAAASPGYAPNLSWEPVAPPDDAVTRAPRSGGRRGGGGGGGGGRGDARGVKRERPPPDFTVWDEFVRTGTLPTAAAAASSREVELFEEYHRQVTAGAGAGAG